MPLLAEAGRDAMTGMTIVGDSASMMFVDVYVCVCVLFIVLIICVLCVL